MSRFKKLTTIAAVAALALGLAACGGGGDDDDAMMEPPAPTPPPMEYDVALPDGHGLSAGTTDLAMGDTVVGDTTISCPATDGCTLTVSMNPVTGAYMGVSTGGEVTVAVADPPAPPMEYNVALPDGHGLMAGTTNLPMGDTVVGDTTISCPAADGCTLTVSMDPVTGSYVGVATGGMVTVAVADPPAPPMEYNVALPDGHGLANGVTTIEPGQTVMRPDGTHLTCPASGEACVLTVSTDNVTNVQSASSTGGQVMVSTTGSRHAQAIADARTALQTAETNLTTAQTTLRLAQEAYDAGTGTRNARDEAQQAVNTAQQAVNTAQMNLDNLLPDPVPVAASGDVTGVTSAALQEAFEGIFPNPGDSDSFTIPAGEEEVRQGVTFACNSDRPCTVTISNSAGTIVASWMSYDVGDAEAMVVASVPPPPHVPADTFAQLNDGSAASIAAIAALAIDTAATDGADGTPNTADDTPRGAYGGSNGQGTTPSHAIGGMGLGNSGAMNFDGFTLTGALDPNTPSADGTATTAATGATMAVGMDNQEIESSADMADFGTSWDLRALFRDWGDDTTDAADGGYETGVLVASDIVAPTSHPFDAMLAGRYANAGAMAYYAFTLLANGTAATDPAPNTSVAIPTTPDAVQSAAVVFDNGSLVPAQTQDINVNAGETFAGTYFGAPGQYQCYGTEPCGIMRNADGMIVLADANTTTDGVQSGTWTFTPDAGAMIMVPDQDWMVFGAWLTTPDVATGDHRMGVFFNGMNQYAGDNDVFTADNANGLHGTATYSGGAAGVYSHTVGTGEDQVMTSGLFTAEASLTANFDVDGDGTADDGDYTVRGQIDNFRGTDGVFLGADTAANPNDPVSGGENDWVVILNQSATLAAGGAIAATATGGSADGVSWSGMWSGQLYGAGDTAENAVAPTGIAGQFQADNAATSVVGAFGAQHQPPASN